MSKNWLQSPDIPFQIKRFLKNQFSTCVKSLLTLILVTYLHHLIQHVLSIPETRRPALKESKLLKSSEGFEGFMEKIKTNSRRISSNGGLRI